MMRFVSETGRYYLLSTGYLERPAHRIETLVRARQQRRELTSGGRFRTVAVGEKVLPLDLENLRDFLMYKSLSGADAYAYEPGTSRIILGALRTSTMFIDVGANIGYFTLLALNRVDAPGNILSVEPNPDTFLRLSRAVASNDPREVVRLVKGAASDQDGEETLFHSPVEDARDSLRPVGTKGTRVRTFRLDSLDLDLRGRDVVVKIDAEGSEERVLRGMTRIIHQADSLSIALEWNPPYAGPSLWAEIERSFDVHQIDEGAPGSVARVSSMGQIRRRFTNLWLVRRDTTGAIGGRPPGMTGP